MNCQSNVCRVFACGTDSDASALALRAAVAVLFLLALAAPVVAQQWNDPSPHSVRFIEVARNIRVEVLDWGGNGRAILFIGCYLTAHVYDDIAPNLTSQFHVYAVT